MKLSIVLDRYNGGWQWTAYADSHEHEIESARTNEQGNGLWVWCKCADQWYADGRPYYEYKQKLGTCQFSLPNNRKRAYGQLYRMYERSTRGG